jgi:hypothetical protein
MEMGFSEDDIVEALEHCEHNFEAATAWLLGVCKFFFLRAVHAGYVILFLEPWLLVYRL